MTHYFLFPSFALSFLGAVGVGVQHYRRRKWGLPGIAPAERMMVWGAVSFVISWCLRPVLDVAGPIHLLQSLFRIFIAVTSFAVWRSLSLLSRLFQLDGSASGNGTVARVGAALVGIGSVCGVGFIVGW